MVHLLYPPSQATADFERYQDRRQFLTTAAMGIASASAASLISIRQAPAAESDAIRPFHIEIPKEGLVSLRERLMMTRWPDRETVADPSQGVQLKTVQQLAHYWRTDYDWRKVEAKLNALQDQAKGASDRARVRIEKRIGEVKADFAMRSKKLNQAWDLTKEALAA